MEKITNRQRKYIQEIREMSSYTVPAFYGTTKQEADRYIRQYEKQAFEEAWENTKGY